MAATISINLDNIKARIKNLKRIDQILLGAGLQTKRHLIRNWLKGSGGDEKAMKPLTPIYANRKAASGRTPKPTLSFTGLMQQSLSVKRLTKTKIDVTFLTEAQRKKAEGNQKIRKNMMALSRRFIKNTTGFVTRELQRK